MDKFNIIAPKNSINNANFAIFNDSAISVSQLNRLTKSLLDAQLPLFWVKGEISGLRSYSHIYLDLKDENSKISCVIFATVLPQLNFKLENGQMVEARGRVSIYPANGSYQLTIEQIRQIGIGELWEAYNRLLSKLKNEGLFAVEHKKQLPLFPTIIGVITSKEGAVIRDIITTLKRRLPSLTIIIYHTAVQGFNASMSIAKAIRTANTRKEVDVLLVCRGGGSMEDLWCFNEEVVAREVYASEIPIISAVGHETDTTIIDFVADLRAATPTAAAELVVKSRTQWLDIIARLHNQLNNNYNAQLNYYKQKLDLYQAKLKTLTPYTLLNNRHNHLKCLYLNLRNIMQMQLQQRANLLKNNYQLRLLNNKPQLLPAQSKLAAIKLRLTQAYQRVLINKNRQIDNLTTQIELINPKNILARGYAIVTNGAAQIIRKSNEVTNKEEITIQFYDSRIKATVNNDKKC